MNGVSGVPGDWRDRAECLDYDPEDWFPVGKGDPGHAAKAVCRGCEVREQCLAWALDVGESFGIWGGLDEEERAALKRRNAKAARAQRRGAPQAAHLAAQLEVAS